MGQATAGLIGLCNMSLIRRSSDLEDFCLCLIVSATLSESLGSHRRAMNCISSKTVLQSHIRALCRLGKLHEALKLFASNPFRLDASLSIKLLQFCIDNKAENCGRLVHSHLTINGVESNVALDTKLIIFYAKIDDMVSARFMFERMRERSVVSWTAMVSGYSQNGNHEDALLVFRNMYREGAKANQFTYGSVLRACTSLRYIEVGMQVHGCIEKTRFAHNLFVQSALIDVHSKCGKVLDASKVFEAMSQRDLVSWNAMIGGYAFQGFPDTSYEIFSSMLKEGIVPDIFSLVNVLKATVTRPSVTKIGQIHCFVIKLGFESICMLVGALVDAYVKCGCFSYAYNLYMNLSEKDVIPLTSLVAGCAHGSNCLKDALDLVKEVKQMEIGLDNVLLCSLISVCANVAYLSVGQQFHAVAIKSQPLRDVALGNALINMYAKCGEIKDASNAFDDMQEKNVISWTTLISGYGKHGFVDEAFSLYKKMENEGLEPNEVTFLSLLFACSHAGLTDEGQQLFHSMINKYDISPRTEHFSCMVDLFARAGHMEEALSLINGMSGKPDGALWGAVLGACNIHGNTTLGEVAARNLFNIDANNATSYVVLASMYGASGAWDTAWKTWHSLDQRGLKKKPGYSLLPSP